MAKAEKCSECGGPPKGRGFAHMAGCSKASAKGGGTQSKPKGDIVASIDGRTRISVLLRLQAKIEEILAAKDKKEVSEVKAALNSVEKLRKQLEEAEARIA